MKLTFRYTLYASYLGYVTQAIIINAIGGGLIEVLISPIVESLSGDEKASAMSLLHSFYCWGHVAVAIGCSSVLCNYFSYCYDYWGVLD